jgi:hypothetical protein
MIDIPAVSIRPSLGRMQGKIKRAPKMIQT